MRKTLCTVVLVSGLWACSSDGDDGPIQVRGQDEVSATIDKRGGELELQDTARVQIPAGALEQPAEIRVARYDEELPRLGEGFERVGEPLVVTPHRLELREPATIEMVITDETAPRDELRVLRLEDEEDRSWEELRGIDVREPQERSDDREIDEDDSVSDKRRISFEVDGFSIFLPVRVVANGDCAGQDEGTVCREAAGPCDEPEVCDGESPDCPPDTFLGENEVCRESDGACDLAETCAGDSAACPDDELRDEGSVCRSSAGACDLPEVCDGESKACPTNALREAGYECRAQNGVCDVPEACDGEGPRCPADTFVAAQTPCRDADLTNCSAAAFCSGSSGSCPASPPAQQGTACDDGLACTQGDQCNSIGGCVAGATDPCAQAMADGDDDCREACVEDATAQQGYTCSGVNPVGTACVQEACEVSTCKADGECTADLECPVFVSIDGGVDDRDGGCGADWGTACATLERGSQVAASTTNERVFVARGNYRADGGSVLVMQDGIAYYGGFAGSENHPDERSLGESDGGFPTPASASVLNANGSSAPVVVGAAGARLDGFEITDLDGGVGLGMHNQGDAGAPLTGLTVANARFHGGTYGYDGGPPGRGMLNEHVDGLTVEHSAFEENRRGTYGTRGAGMATLDGLNVTISDTRFVGNQLSVSGSGSYTLAGAGLYHEGGSSLVLDTVEFRDNYMYGYTYEGHVACMGAGMAHLVGSHTLRHVTFENNDANCSEAVGAGLYTEDLNPSTLNDVAFTNNDANGNYRAAGGGFMVVANAGSVSASLTDVTFESNGVYGSSSAGGGGLAALDVSDGQYPSMGVSLNRATFVANQARSYTRPQGGGLYMQAGAGTLDVQDAEIIDNEVGGYEGGGESAGGGLYADVGQASLTQVSFARNQANGAGSSESGPVEGGGAVLVGDSASGMQSAIEPTADLHNVDFYANIAEGGYGYSSVSAQGGGLSSRNVRATLVDTDFVGNAANAYGNFSAQAYGAGLHHEGTSSLTIVNVGFVDNTAYASASSFASTGGGGAGVNLSGDASYDIDNATFVNNAPDGLYAGGPGEIHHSIFANGQTNIVATPAPTAGPLCTTTASGADIPLADPISPTELTVTADGLVFLPGASPCIDAGDSDDTRANEAFGSNVWTTMTTDIDGTPLDMSPIDMGRHYLPAQPIIEEFYDAGGQLNWTTRQPTGTLCVITDEQGSEPYTLPTVMGTLSQPDFYGYVTLTCTNGALSTQVTIEFYQALD